MDSANVRHAASSLATSASLASTRASESVPSCTCNGGFALVAMAAAPLAGDRRVDCDGIAWSTVHGKISLPVTVEVECSQYDTARHWLFENSCRYWIAMAPLDRTTSALLIHINSSKLSIVRL